MCLSKIHQLYLWLISNSSVMKQSMKDKIFSLDPKVRENYKIIKISNIKSTLLQLNKFIFIYFLLLSTNIFSQNITHSSNSKLLTNDSSILVKEFLKEIIEHPQKFKDYNLFPNFDDCKMIFKPDAAIEYINYWILNKPKLEEKEDKIIKIEVYKFTKNDILDTSINSRYKGGQGMRSITDKINFSIPMTFYGCIFKTESGLNMSNIFFFNNGKTWKSLYKPFPWKRLYKR